MREIARILCGSHLYGANVEGSDRDYKIVYVPSARQILLGKHRTRQEYEKQVREARERLVEETCCQVEEIKDLEFFDLQHFLRLACQGQTNAMDMLFAPNEYYVGRPAYEWGVVRWHRKQFVSRNCKAFVGYCRQQVKKYVLKKDRLQALEEAVAFLLNAFEGGPHSSHDRLREIENLSKFAEQNPHTELVDRATAHGELLPHLSVCETLVPVTATLKTALDTYARKAEEYGQRVRRASNLHTEDWKSMYHAIRVAKEAIELMVTGRLTFPRPEKDLLLTIRKGELPYEEVSKMIEDHLEIVQAAVEATALPEEPDWKFADELVAEFYRTAVVNSQE